MSFTEWTVLPHGPIEKLAPNLWTVSGTMPKGNQRCMTAVRLADGRLVLHNAIALAPSEMEELDAWGKVAAIVVPNSYHRQDARIFSERYPDARVYAPKAAVAKVSRVAKVAGDYDAIPSDEHVQAQHLDGMNGKEGVILVRSAEGTTAIFNDVVLNMEASFGVKGFLLAPTGRPSIPRSARWMMIRDKAALAAHLRRIAGERLCRLIVGHGPRIEQDPAAILRGLAEEID